MAEGAKSGTPVKIKVEKCVQLTGGLWLLKMAKSFVLHLPHSLFADTAQIPYILQRHFLPVASAKAVFR